MQKMLLRLVFCPVEFGVRDRRTSLTIWSELLDAKSRENQLD